MHWRWLFLFLIFTFSLPTTASGATFTKTEITYTTIDDTPLKLDLCSPSRPTTKMPTLVFIHGGGFRGGDKSQGTNFFCQFLPEHGYIFVSVNYRLSPQTQYPGGFDDVQYAIRWLRHHASAYHIDPDRIAASGSSAGSTFASLLGVRDTRHPARGLSQYSSRVGAVIPFAGVQDFNGPLGSFKPLEYYFNNNVDYINEASPVTHLTSDDAAFLLIHGDQDTTVLPTQSTSFANQLKALHIPYQTIFFSGGHGIGAIPNNQKDNIQNQIVAFLHTHLTAVSPTHTPTPTSTKKPSSTPTIVPTLGLTPTRRTSPSPTSTPLPSDHPSPTPTIPSTLTPTSPPSALCQSCPGTTHRSSGDANCDGATDVLDFSIWQKEYFDGHQGVDINTNWSADFTCDSLVDVLDFSVWQKNFD